MTRHAWDILYWGIIWIGIGFFAAELAGASGAAPWGTLTSTVRWAITYPLVGMVLMGVVIFLPTHLLFGRPVVVSLSFGIIVSAVAHLFFRSLP